MLAATLSPTYGIYSGYESFENEPVRAGSEEYLDSEKYEARPRSLDGPLLPLVAALNRARRAEPALQVVDNIRWLETENDALVAYAKDDVVCVVNIDPHSPQAGACVIPVALGYPARVRRARAAHRRRRSRGARAATTSSCRRAAATS